MTQHGADDFQAPHPLVDKATLQYVLRGILITNSTSVASGDNVLSVQEISFASELVKYCTIVISTLPIMCVYPFLTKYFEKGVMIGAVKG